MRTRPLILIAGLAVAGLAAGTPATAAPLDKGRFHDVGTDLFHCDRTPARQRRYVRQLPAQPARLLEFPYYRESTRGRIGWTNLNTGGTFTQVFTANRQTTPSSTTVTAPSPPVRLRRCPLLRPAGKLVLKDPGEIRFAFEVDYNGTPGNPDDDQEVPASFRVVRDPTGRNDTEGRDFCADVLQFTS